MSHWFLDPSDFVNEEYGKYKGKRNGFEENMPQKKKEKGTGLKIV